jgi:hypothetical protein
LSESPKVRHGKARSQNSISADPVRTEEKTLEKDKGKNVDVQLTSKLESPITNDSKKDEEEIVEVVDKFRHGVLNVDAEVFKPQATPELKRVNLESEIAMNIESEEPKELFEILDILDSWTELSYTFDLKTNMIYNSYLFKFWTGQSFPYLGYGRVWRTFRRG